MDKPTVSPFQSSDTAQESKLIHYKQAVGDFGHFIVYRLVLGGRNEIIGHVYTEIDGDETRYISTNQVGREIFPPTTEFNSIDLKFERYARLIDVNKDNQENQSRTNSKNYSSTKKNIAMTNKTQSTQKARTNQLIFIEYEKPTKEGHQITIVDSFRNNIGRIYKNYNEELKKFEYTSFDHEGNLLAKNEKLWVLKNDFISNRELHLENAHQRRIEANENKVQETEKNTKSKKQGERKVETKPIQENKNVEKFELTKDNKPLAQQTQNTEINEEVQDSREQELEDLRGEKEDERGEHDLER